MSLPNFRVLGTPAVRIGGVSVWVRGREFPDSNDYWDGNWLEVTVYCQYPGARVWCEGPLIHAAELQGFLTGCEDLHRSLTGQANLDCLEPNLAIQMVGNGRGAITMKVTVTPDSVRQTHAFEEEIDQSYLPAIVSGCREILSRFPIVGASEHAEHDAG